MAASSASMATRRPLGIVPGFGAAMSEGSMSVRRFTTGREARRDHRPWHPTGMSGLGDHVIRDRAADLARTRPPARAPLAPEMAVSLRPELSAQFIGIE